MKKPLFENFESRKLSSGDMNRSKGGRALRKIVPLVKAAIIYGGIFTGIIYSAVKLNDA